MAVVFDETMADVLVRRQDVALRLPFQFLDAGMPGGLRPKTCLEVCGSSGTGKTSVLMSMAAEAVLPVQHNGVAIGGAGVGVVLIDTAGQFDVFRFVRMLEARMQDRTKARGAAIPQYNRLIKNSLARLHVIRCMSSVELLCTLHRLPALLGSLAGSSDAPARMVIVDTVTAFVWPDRLAKSNDVPGLIAAAVARLQAKCGMIVAIGVATGANEKSVQLHPGWSKLQRCRATLTKPAPTQDTQGNFLIQVDRRIFQFTLDERGVTDIALVSR